MRQFLNHLGNLFKSKLFICSLMLTLISSGTLAMAFQNTSFASSLRGKGDKTFRSGDVNRTFKVEDATVPHTPNFMQSSLIGIEMWKNHRDGMARKMQHPKNDSDVIAILKAHAITYLSRPEYCSTITKTIPKNEGCRGCSNINSLC